MKSLIQIGSSRDWSFQADAVQRAYNAALIALQADEFQESDRYGEYGLSVGKFQRRSSAPTAGPRRTNAFYTYCATEFYTMYGGPEFHPQIERTLNFTRKKVEQGAYWAHRTYDEYEPGTFERCSDLQINYRHTFIFGQILALLDLDKNILQQIRAHLLSDSAQHKSGGWLIWGHSSDDAVDKICSCHALILLQYFRARAQSDRDYDALDTKMRSTVDYFLHERNDRCLWNVSSGDLHQSLQMSAWYFVVLLPFLIVTHPDEAKAMYHSLCRWLKREQQQELSESVLFRELQIRLVYASVVARPFGFSDYDDDARSVFENLLASKEAAPDVGLTTYALTRYLMLLREFQNRHVGRRSTGRLVFDRILAAPFPITDWLRWMIDTKKAMFTLDEKKK